VEGLFAGQGGKALSEALFVVIYSGTWEGWAWVRPASPSTAFIAGLVSLRSDNTIVHNLKITPACFISDTPEWLTRDKVNMKERIKKGQRENTTRCANPPSGSDRGKGTR
jgi:hypothetical protein